MRVISERSGCLCFRGLRALPNGLFCVWHEFYIVWILYCSSALIWCYYFVLFKTYRIQEEPLYVEVPDIYPFGKGSVGKYLAGPQRWLANSKILYTEESGFWQVLRKLIITTKVSNTAEQYKITSEILNRDGECQNWKDFFKKKPDVLGNGPSLVGVLYCKLPKIRLLIVQTEGFFLLGNIRYWIAFKNSVCQTIPCRMQNSPF